MGESSSNQNLKKSYKDILSNSPLEPHDLEFMLDCPDNHILLEYKNFEPKKTLKLLVQRASSTTPPTPPNQFLEEMNELVTIGKTRAYYKGKHVEETKEARYLALAKKYEMETEYDSKRSEPGVITYERLTFTFPQYFAMKEIGPSPFVIPHWKEQVPQFFACPQFGGLIPSRECTAMPQDVKKAIATVHIYGLLNHSTPKMPVRSHLVLLRKWIESGALSDDRRLRFLQNNHVVTMQEIELTQNFKNKFEYIESINESREEVRDIPWDLLFD